jgi:tRNA A-37 threonylcarbamoyl transferase component Bud32
MLHELKERGFGVPSPVCCAHAGGRSVVVSLEVPGRPLDALLREAVLSGTQAAAAAYCSEIVAPVVRRLHDSGLFHRDLYWNHLYAESPLGSEPRLIDVERVFRPRWRVSRWRVKDLAALLSSTPPEFSRTARLRFLRSYLVGSSSSWRELAPRIWRKAQRMKSRRPKYG